MKKTNYSILFSIVVICVVLLSGCDFLNNLFGIKGSISFGVGMDQSTGSSAAGTVKLLSVPTGYYTPTELIGTIKKIEITTDGTAWTTVFEDTDGEAFDVAGGSTIAPIGEAVEVTAGTYHGVRIYIGDEITGEVVVGTTTVSGSLTGYEDNNPYVWKTPDNTLSEAFILADGVETTINFIFNVKDIVIISSGGGASLAQPVVTVIVQ